jgi:hypothetical protein
MNVKSKSIIIIVTTLLLGIIIGIFVGGLIRTRIFQDRISRFRSPEGFFERVEKIIQPTPEQANQLRNILSEHHKIAREMARESHLRMRALEDSLRMQLESILTPEQLKRFSKRWHKRRMFFPDHPRPPKEEIRKRRRQEGPKGIID